MNRHTFRSSIFMVAMLAASAAFAGADIIKCVDQDGKLTLTDAQCGDGVRTVAAAGADTDTAAMASTDNQAEESAVEAPAPVARRAGPQRVAYAPPTIQHDTPTAPRAGKMLSRDVETLKAARLSMQVLDSASAMARHQRLAGLN
jgi:hypothetical protein